MDKRKNNSSTGLTPRSRRSQTNLSDLRLAPLSAKYTQAPKDLDASKSSYEQPYDSSFTRSHPSYIQGKSAPTSPGILSRSSSRRHLHGGLSRRGSLYEDEGTEEAEYEYAGNTPGPVTALRRELADGVPKAKSDAALLAQRTKLSEKERQARAQKLQRLGRRSTGRTTPELRRKQKAAEDDWLTRTGATANAILQESKGQSWLASRPSATTLMQQQDTTDEEDEGYEEMAALSAIPRRRHQADGELSPVTSRASGWGSRYGSRTASRRTSRRGSMSMTTGSRTPLAGGGHDGVADYFGEDGFSPTEQAFVNDDEEDDSYDEAAVAKFMQDRSFGLGGLVDRVMNFNIWKVEEREESATEDEIEQFRETPEQAKARRDAENRRKREAKEKLANRSTTEHGEGDDGQGEGGWSDAAWLLSVASKAMF